MRDVRILILNSQSKQRSLVSQLLAEMKDALRDCNTAQAGRIRAFSIAPTAWTNRTKPHVCQYMPHANTAARGAMLPHTPSPRIHTVQHFSKEQTGMLRRPCHQGRPGPGTDPPCPKFIIIHRTVCSLTMPPQVPGVSACLWPEATPQ